MQMNNIQNILDILTGTNALYRNNAQENLSLSEKINEIILQSPNKPNYPINLLEITNIPEPLTSKVLTEIFKYKNNNEHILLKSFIERFLAPCGFEMDWFTNPQIMAEKQDRVDICIQENNKYAVVIENKLKGADFQRNQLARYIQCMREKGYSDERIYVIVLPKNIDSNFFNNINKSVWRLPPDWKKPNQERSCRDDDAISCKCDNDMTCPNCELCRKDMRERFKNRTEILDLEFMDWLQEECFNLVPENEVVLKSAIIQFVDFLKGIYNKRFNTQLIMEIVYFLRDKLLTNEESVLEKWNTIEKKKKEVKELLEGLESLQTDISLDMIDLWRKELATKWGKWLRFEEHKSFGININGVWCGCWCESCEPFWGFFYTESKDEDKDMVKKIVEKAEKEPCSTAKKGWYEWNSTKNGAEDCDALYQAAVDLGFIK